MATGLGFIISFFDDFFSEGFRVLFLSWFFRGYFFTFEGAVLFTSSFLIFSSSTLD